MRKPKNHAVNKPVDLVQMDTSSTLINKNASITKFAPLDSELSHPS
jgi:hypothetical protein